MSKKVQEAPETGLEAVNDKLTSTVEKVQQNKKVRKNKKARKNRIVRRRRKARTLKRTGTARKLK